MSLDDLTQTTTITEKAKEEAKKQIDQDKYQ